ncbi:MAG: hypothetical protein HY328_06855 [Chloroflexi bacterium]|nr:hypothetical protein [Chloroflexota bacterium]
MLALVLAGCETFSAPPAANPQPARSLVEATATPQADNAVVEPTAQPTPEVASPPEGLSRGGDTMTVGGSPTKLIERAKAEAATLARSSAESVQVVSVEGVDWSDSSLGCPQAGMMYAQVITPGYKIVLESGGRTYEFHTALDPAGPLVRCGG